jgi:hypothetical protein
MNDFAWITFHREGTKSTFLLDALPLDWPSNEPVSFTPEQQLLLETRGNVQLENPVNVEFKTTVTHSSLVFASIFRMAGGIWSTKIEKKGQLLNMFLKKEDNTWITKEWDGSWEELVSKFAEDLQSPVNISGSGEIACWKFPHCHVDVEWVKTERFQETTMDDIPSLEPVPPASISPCTLVMDSKNVQLFVEGQNKESGCISIFSAKSTYLEKDLPTTVIIKVMLEFKETGWYRMEKKYTPQSTPHQYAVPMMVPIYHQQGDRVEYDFVFYGNYVELLQVTISQETQKVPYQKNPVIVECKVKCSEIKELVGGTDQLNVRTILMDLADPPLDHDNQLIYRGKSNSVAPFWGQDFVFQEQKEMVTFTIEGKNHFHLYDVVKRDSSPLSMDVFFESLHNKFASFSRHFIIDDVDPDLIFSTPDYATTIKVSILCEDWHRIEECKVRTYPTNARLIKWVPGSINGLLGFSRKGTYLVYGALCLVDGRLSQTKIRKANGHVPLKMMTIRSGTIQPSKIESEFMNAPLHSVLVMQLD